MPGSSSGTSMTVFSCTTAWPSALVGSQGFSRRDRSAALSHRLHLVETLLITSAAVRGHGPLHRRALVRTEHARRCRLPDVVTCRSPGSPSACWGRPRCRPVPAAAGGPDFLAPSRSLPASSLCSSCRVAGAGGVSTRYKRTATAGLRCRGGHRHGPWTYRAVVRPAVRG